MPSSFTLKTIRLMITLGAGVFANTNKNAKIIEGLAVDVSVEKAGLPDLGKCSADIVGMNYDDMEQLTTLSFRKLHTAKNVLTVWAGDKGSELSKVFEGEITSASADFTQAPNVVFHIEAQTGAYSAKIPSPPVSVQGNTSVADLARRFASEMGYNFQNEGVTTSVKNSVYNGSPLQKLKKLEKQTGVSFYVDDGAVVLAPRTTARRSEVIPLINKNSGLIGYPTFDNDGVTFDCLFNPDLVYGARVKLETIVPRASGIWKITKLTHSLSAYKSSGNWRSSVSGAWTGDDKTNGK